MADRVPVWDRRERGVIRPALSVLFAVPWAVAAAASEAWDDARPHLTAAGLRVWWWLGEVDRG